ncbi:MAG: HlyD family efflux transporter periplasmic adaptor subunit [Anaerolineaceae bacterium]|nr:HlyD family efflux transporter periplasmic adaptor subunit [Anaerolineaceae bacterium]
MKRLSTITITLLLVCSAAASLVGCTPTAQAAVQAAANPTATVLAPVKSGGLTVSEGSVVPVKHVDITFLATGVVSAVNIPEGSLVKSDDLIASLDGKQTAQAAVAGAQLALVSAQQDLDNLNKNADVAKANAEMAVATAAKALDDAKKNLDRKDYKPVNDYNLNNARAAYELAVNNLQTAQDDYSSVANRAEDDVIRNMALAALSNAQLARDKALWNLNYLLGLPNTLDVNQASAQVQVAQANLDAANRALDRVKNGPDTDQLALATASVTNATAQLAAAQEALTDLDLKAPFDGTVVSNNLKVGQFVSPAAPAPVTIADLSEYDVETTDLTELNVVNIKIGSQCQVTFDAIPDLTLNGTVEKIDKLGVNKQGDITYTVTIKLEKQDPRLLWNMTASVNFQ